MQFSLKAAPMLGLATLAALGLAAIQPAMAGTVTVTQNNPQGWSSDNYDFQPGNHSVYTTGNPDETQFSNAYGDLQGSGNGALVLTIPDKDTEAGFGLGVDTPLTGVSLSSITSLSYDYYRNSTSAPGTLPAIGIYDQTADKFIIWDPTVNSSDNWVSSGDIIGTSHFRSGGFNYSSLADLESAGTVSSSDSVGEIEFFGGSDWNGFSGAVDNFTLGLNGQDTTYDFSTVPEPSSVAAFAFTGLGALGMMLKARKRSV